MSIATYLQMLGLSKSYFRSMKYGQPILHRYLLFIGNGCIIKGHERYLNHSRDIKHKISEMYFEDDNGFIKFLVKSKIVIHKQNANRFLDGWVFSNDNLNIKSYKIAKQILKHKGR